MPIDGWMDKENNSLDGPWGHYVKWNKTDKDKYCMISPICGIKRKKREPIKTENRLGREVGSGQNG